ncbi:polysaccharide deacetylase [Ahniella affigens]|uniref:Polysaccharide deacetylase n=1 Tax=Ahniella affigens TaxID=2021234 RepID=A0A2P1PLQ5_9GAMM|nr:polysaccharide deacetylase family protein [Ahniella affigens]AVP95768.1 polysaccharide deacetylase [Ahniella affigens]
MFLVRVQTVLLALFLVATNTQAEPGKTLSVTIDDLPWVSLPDRAPADLSLRHQALITHLRTAGIPVIGFVNEYKLVDDGTISPVRVQMLRDWLDAGFALGNHSRDHLDLHVVGLSAFTDNIIEGEQVLRPLLAEYHAKPTWFRHPYLHAGHSSAERAALAAFLHTHGYRVAPVTIDNSEWIYAKAYHDCVRDARCKAATRRTLVRSYVPYMRAKIRYYEGQSQQFFGRQIAQVLLLHANELNAAAIDQLLDMIRAEGYRFVSLETALQDPVYTSPDGYDGAAGPSWIHRFALAQGFKGADFAGEPRVPDFVLRLARVDGE